MVIFATNAHKPPMGAKQSQSSTGLDSLRLSSRHRGGSLKKKTRVRVEVLFSGLLMSEERTFFRHWPENSKLLIEIFSLRNNGASTLFLDKKACILSAKDWVDWGIAKKTPELHQRRHLLQG